MGGGRPLDGLMDLPGEIADLEHVEAVEDLPQPGSDRARLFVQPFELEVPVAPRLQFAVLLAGLVDQALRLDQELLDLADGLHRRSKVARAAPTALGASSRVDDGERRVVDQLIGRLILGDRFLWRMACVAVAAVVS